MAETEENLLEIESDLYNPITQWELSVEAINAIAECGIKSLNLLKMITTEDVNDIFNERKLLGEKIKFRYNLQIWRQENKAQLKECKDLLNSGIRTIYLHCLGNCVNRGINLALNLINDSNGALLYIINTSTIELIDESHSLFDGDEITINERQNSAVHIEIFRNVFFEIDQEDN